MWFAVVVAVVLVALTVAGVMGRIDGSLDPPTTSASYVPLPGDRLTPADLESLRLDTALRGYRMDQVDEVIGRLGHEIRALTERLDGTGPEPQPATADPAAAGADAAAGAPAGAEADAERA